MFFDGGRQSNNKNELPKKTKTTKVRKGRLAVRVGVEEEKGGFETFVIPISDLDHPLYHDLLEKAKEVYGCHTAGLLRLPCSVEEFRQLRCKVKHDSNVLQNQYQYHHSLLKNFM